MKSFLLVIGLIFSWSALSEVPFPPKTPDICNLPPIVVPPVIAEFDPFAIAISCRILKLQKQSQKERAAANCPPNLPENQREEDLVRRLEASCETDLADLPVE